MNAYTMCSISYSPDYFRAVFFMVFSKLIIVHSMAINESTTQTTEVQFNRTQWGNQETQHDGALKSKYWDKLWHEEWSNWIALQNPNPPNANPFVNMTKEQIFLTVLHMGYKSSNLSKCEDKNRMDCPVWANLGYCDHERLRYSTWMAENCPQSCMQCKETLATRDEYECKNLRNTCDRLSRFCSGPFETHMQEWCPKSCRVCNDSTDSDQEDDISENSTSLKSTNVVQNEGYTGAPTQQATHETISDDQMCFPEVCGTAPAMKYRLGGARKKRSSMSEFTLLDRLRRDAEDRKSPSSDPGIKLKIVGGYWATKGEFPWHGMILQKLGKFVRFCGVTVICKHWLVTAAHCLVSTELGFPDTKDKMDTFTIYVGRHQGMFAYMEASTQVYRKDDIEKFIIHPDFRIRPSFKYDIALIKLSSPLEFNNYVQPICLPTVNTNRQGDALWTYGWGATLDIGPGAQYLKKVDLPYVNRSECQRFLWGVLDKGIMCAGGEAQKDTCTGDSGGSLVKQANDGRFYIYGVTSYGNKHCNSRYPYSPGVYTDVAHYYTWIRNQTMACCDARSVHYGNIVNLKGFHDSTESAR